MKPVYHIKRADIRHAHSDQKARKDERRKEGRDDQCPRCGRWFKNAARSHRDKDGVRCIVPPDAVAAVPNNAPPVVFPRGISSFPQKPHPTGSGKGVRSWGVCETEGCESIVSGERRFCGACVARRPSGGRR